MKTHMTDSGAVISASIIQTGLTGAVRGGYIQDCPKTRYKIALREDGDSWEALYDQGGDDSGIGSDNLFDVLAIGAMDDSHETDADRLRDGAREIESWADRVAQIDAANEAIQECADYLRERAAAAVAAADEIGDDEYAA